MDGGIVLVFFSLICLVLGVKLWQKGNLLITTGITTSGIIYRNNFKRGSGSSGGVYYPVVRFLTEKEEWITQELNFGRNPPMQEGAEVTVIYDPEDPTNVDIKSTFMQVIMPRILVAIGITGIIAGLLGYLDIIELQSLND